MSGAPPHHKDASSFPTNTTRLQREHRQRAADPAFRDEYRIHRPIVERSIAWLTRGNRRAPRRGISRNNAWLDLRIAGRTCEVCSTSDSATPTEPGHWPEGQPPAQRRLEPTPRPPDGPSRNTQAIYGPVPKLRSISRHTPRHQRGPTARAHEFSRFLVRDGDHHAHGVGSRSIVEFLETLGPLTDSAAQRRRPRRGSLRGSSRSTADTSSAPLLAPRVPGC